MNTRISWFQALNSLILAMSGVLLLPSCLVAQSCKQELVSVPARPTFTAPSDTTRCGVLELGYGWSWQRLPNGDSTQLVNGLFRLGITDRLDLRWGADNLSTLHSSGSNSAGFGDSYLGTTLRFRNQSPRIPAFALSYTTKIPTANATRGLGSGELDHTAMFIASKDFGLNHFDFNLIEFFAGRPAGNGFDRSTMIGTALSRPIYGNWTGFIEGYGGTALNDAAPSFAATFAALTYKVNPRLVLDAGFGYGFTQGIPKHRLQFGATFALGTLFTPSRALTVQRNAATRPLNKSLLTSN